MANSEGFLGPTSPCSYLPGHRSRFEYAWLGESTAGDYGALMDRGWRRFGKTAFRPRCRACSECRSLRIVVDRFRPDRSQRRAWKANSGEVQLQIGPPSINEARFSLHERYHAYQAEAKDWPSHEGEGVAEYVSTFIENPFPTEEWTYRVGDDLAGIGFVDAVPGALSAIYFFYDPGLRDRSLGTFNILSIVDEARRRGLPHVHLGYFVEGCPSMRYKARFVPNQTLERDGIWADFRPGTG